jgi:LacI family transcriptional regulator
MLIDRIFTELSVNFVGVDDFASGVLATQHLIDKGCKRTPHLCARQKSPGAQYFKGYKDTLRRAKLHFSEKDVI